MTEIVLSKSKRSEIGFAREAARRALKQRTMTEVKSLARTQTLHAVNTLTQIMRDKKAPAHARVCAANSLLDRGWGKSLQRFASEDGTPLEFLHRIERVIVHPGDPVNDPVIDATIEESVQRVPLSVLGSVGATNDFDVSPEDVWLRSQEQT